ncbi:MAG: 5-formyltetrahydrofolate cyclo-ligase [Caldimicrobium sp.]|nr:5-formyltetrahydrofolate cyclo-ligase [Caldimicrobium sp.]MCX7873270.1 5-formyltetrahydrofolate cyclo-ligase [Caldimicrobium sp.]MDW8094726.1 5-formyltetrahydrofolate cyclo-ligase [Caldimicrobium sp.]
MSKAPRKELLRKFFKELRLKLNPQEWQVGSIKICQMLLESAYYAKAKRIAFYSCINQEVDLNYALLEALREKEVFLPKTDLKGQTLTFHRILDLRSLTPGPFGILEPPPEAPIVEVAKLDIILVPGLAFDKRRGRLGYGKGFYDKTLRDTRGLKIGVAFSCQIIEELPLEPYDVKMDLILTEKGWL